MRKASGSAPTPPSYEAQALQIAELLDRWSTAANASSTEGTEPIDHWPLKLVYPLEHAYTPAEIGFDGLKGADDAVARVLGSAASKAGVELHLALLRKWESGSAEYVGRNNWHYRRGQRDAGAEESVDDFEVVEVFDSRCTLSQWRRVDGAASALAEIPVEDDEVAPPDALEDMEPDEEHFHEATGNEGASFDRTYARAALVMWPSRQLLCVLNQAGLDATLPYLEQLARQWRAGGADGNSPLKAEALELAGHMLATWPDRPRLSRIAPGWWRAAEGLDDLSTDDDEDQDEDDNEDVADRPSASPVARLLAALTVFGDKDKVVAALDRLMAQASHDKADNIAILDSLALFRPDRAVGLLLTIVVANAVDAPGACADLLRRASSGPFARRPKQLQAAATALVDLIPGDPALAPQDQWGRPRVATADASLVADLAALVDRVEAGLATRAARHILAWPKHYDPDKVLVPAAKSMAAADPPAGPAVSALHAAAVAHLKARIALALEAPRNWARPSEIVTCKCPYCRDLAAFLADPSAETWTLRAAQQHRTHVENEIRRARADVDHRTERKGSPLSLICRKNQASYERRVKQRKQDLADLAALTAQKRTRGKTSKT